MIAPDLLDQVLEARIRAVGTRARCYHVAVHRFLAYLERDFPHVHCLSELRRDPHWLGWVHCLHEEDPPLSNFTCRIYPIAVRRLLRELARDGHAVQPDLIRAVKKDQQLPQPVRRTYSSRSQPHPLFEPILESRIRSLATSLRPHTVVIHRVAARRFLCYLQSEFPQLTQLSQLQHDPHMLGWLRCLCHQEPPLSPDSRQTYVYALRHLFQDVVIDGHALQLELFLPGATPPRHQQGRRRTTQPQLHPSVFREIFDARIQSLAITLRSGTIQHYRTTAHHFLTYLQTEFPQLRELSELRRDPHLLGWFRWLCERTPPLCNATRLEYLLNLRRLLHDFAAQGHPLQSNLITPTDFPRIPKYLPRALSPEQDQLLQQELRRTDDLFSNALLLTRATGIRIGECIHLAYDCLRQIGQDQWALHVPLGKLYTERLVPVDDEVRQLITRIQNLRAEAPASQQTNSAGFLLLHSGSVNVLYTHLRLALHRAAARINSPDRITPHRLRHSFASEMVRLGVGVPALMQLLGHNTAEMTMRYVKVIQSDLQREFHLARQNAVHRHHIPELPVATSVSATVALSGIQRALAASRHLLEMYRRQLQDERSRRKLQRLDKRLRSIAADLQRFTIPEK
jgi:site-specific recombinase XerD